MKNVLFRIVLGITAMSFIACDMNDPNEDKFANDPQSGWIEFASNGATSVEIGGCEVEVPFVLNAPVNTDGVDVYYTITDIEGSSAGLQSYASVPAGSNVGNFVVTNSETLTAPVEFTLTLTSTSRDNVSIGYPCETVAQTMTVRIIPAGIASFVGTFDVAETSSEGAFSYESVITMGTAPNELILSNIYGVDPDAQTSVFVNEDGSLSFPDFNDNFLFTANGGAQVFLEGLSGTANSCDSEIVVNFNLRTGAGGNTVTGPYRVVLTRQ